MKIEIIPFSEKHKKDVLKISEKEIGKNFIDENYLNSFLNNTNAKGVVAIINGKVAGFTFFQWLKGTELHQYIFTNKDWLKEVSKRKKLIGYRNLTAVKNSFQNYGIGKKLVEVSIAELKQKTNFLANVVWITDRKKNLGKTLEKFGLKPLKTIADYWKSDSIKRNYECAICGSPPCTCKALIYFSC